MPCAIDCGISYSDFFKLNCKRLKPIIDMKRKRDKFNADMIDMQSWLTGLYVQYAIAACFSKEASYPSMSFNEQAKETERVSEAQEREIASVRFKEWASVFNRKKQQKDKEDGRNNIES